MNDMRQKMSPLLDNKWSFIVYWREGTVMMMVEKIQNKIVNTQLAYLYNDKWMNDQHGIWFNATFLGLLVLVVLYYCSSIYFIIYLQ